ncbi:hypothetical protein TNIN_336541 [Trichonephila inaurata madagascariensis]|uniref:Uncharacterized protein n=1 Tax=Trichonephila inaurata madagascariensis TaxID=2747483 RepID=A0A8X6YBA1_9ARAC|nr:hypothetical protein TNIN_336541 [Trichonephila inaurata madagascariensis]
MSFTFGTIHVYRSVPLGCPRQLELVPSIPRAVTQSQTVPERKAHFDEPQVSLSEVKTPLSDSKRDICLEMQIIIIKNKERTMHKHDVERGE